MKKRINKAVISLDTAKYRLLNNRGEIGVDTLVKTLITIVVAALLLGGITALINALFPEITAKIFDMFGLGGGAAASGTTS